MDSYLQNKGEASKNQRTLLRNQRNRTNNGDRNGSSRKESRLLMTKINYRMFIDTIWSWFDAPV